LSEASWAALRRPAPARFNKADLGGKWFWPLLPKQKWLVVRGRNLGLCSCIQIQCRPIHRRMLGCITIDEIDFAVDSRIPGRVVVPFCENLSGGPSNNHCPNGYRGTICAMTMARRIYSSGLNFLFFHAYPNSPHRLPGIMKVFNLMRVHLEVCPSLDHTLPLKAEPPHEENFPNRK
jgi:hypothetical protein